MTVPAYPALLAELRIALGRALGINPQDFGGIAERAATVRGLTNDYNFDAFADRAAAIEEGTAATRKSSDRATPDPLRKNSITAADLVSATCNAVPLAPARSIAS